jgi:hypothetical protein
MHAIRSILKLQKMKNSGKKGTGRPSTTEARENTTGIRLTKAERFIIVQKARRTGMNLTTYIRQMAINGKVVGRFSEEDRQIVRELIQMSSDIHQVATVAKEAGILKATHHYEALRDRIDQLLNWLDHDK